MYICQCGTKLQKVTLKGSSHKPKTEQLSYKVLVVTTVSHYKCPNGCELKEVKKV